MDPVVILGEPSVTVTPGNEVRTTVRVRNLGRRVEGFRLDVVGPARAFARIEPPSLSILPNRELTAEVVFAPVPGPSTPVGAVPFGVRAVSEVDGSSAVAEAELHVGGLAGLDARVVEPTRQGRWSADYALAFENGGNTAVRLAIVGHDPAGELALRATPDSVDLGPGAAGSAQLRVRARRPFLRGSPQIRQFQVSTYDFPFGADRPEPGWTPRPGSDPYYRSFPATFRQVPVLGKGLVALLALATVGVLALLALRLRQGTIHDELRVLPPPVPAAVAFASAQPSSLVLQWQPSIGAVGYKVFEVTEQGAIRRVASDVAEGEQVAVATIEALEPATRYCFAVQAVGLEEQSSAPSAPGCSATVAPTGLVAPSLTAAIEGTKVTLGWATATGDPAPNQRFDVYQDNKRVLELAPDASAPLDVVADGAEHCFRVALVELDTTGNRSTTSDLSERACVTAPAPAPSTTLPAPGGVSSIVTLAPGVAGGGPVVVPGGSGSNGSGSNGSGSNGSGSNGGGSDGTAPGTPSASTPGATAATGTAGATTDTGGTGGASGTTRKPGASDADALATGGEFIAVVGAWTEGSTFPTAADAAAAKQRATGDRRVEILDHADAYEWVIVTSRTREFSPFATGVRVLFVRGFPDEAAVREFCGSVGCAPVFARPRA